MSGFAVPGIRFVVDTPTPDAALPRMDIAGFVGLAASGPVGVPVVVEDEVSFTDIFGGDLALAWDTASGKQQSALLAASVRAFFRGGGTRCWVVRVTGPTASTQRFPLLGTLARRSGAKWRGATIAARSVGSWADGMQVETRLRALAVTRYVSSPAEAGQVDAVEVDNLVEYDDWREGDLIAVHHRSGRFEYRRVISVSVHPLRAHRRWLRHERVLGVEPIPDDAWPSGKIDLRINNAKGGFSTRKQCAWSVALEVELSGLALPQRGEILCGEMKLAGDRRALALRVAEVSTERGADAATVMIDAAWFIDIDALDADTDPVVRTERLRLDLRGHRGGSSVHLAGLGFDAVHPRGWARLPDDQLLYPWPDSSTPPSLDDAAEVIQEVGHPRFPLAGLDPKPMACVPLGMTAVPDERWRAGPMAAIDPLSAFARDGLDSYDHTVLFDAELATHGTNALPAEAFHRRYRNDTPLSGLHALYFIAEIASLVVPDAVHSVWRKQVLDEAETAIARADCDAPTFVNGRLTLNWRKRGQGRVDHWRVQSSEFPDFSAAVDEQLATTTVLLPETDPVCTRRLWFRVRAEFGRDVGPWSNTVSALPLSAPFARCEDWLPVAPVLSIDGDLEFRCRFAWQHPALDAGNGGVEFELQEATRADFADAELLYRGSEDSFELLRPLREAAYYRVRALYDTAAGDAATGPWSETLSRAPTGAQGWRMDSSQVDDKALLAVHRAMITMAAARADLFTVLSLPATLEYREVEAYRAALVAAFRDGSNEGERVLSHAALYHPWAVLAAADGVRPMPPDGLVLGEFARRAQRQGAWVAPANHPFGEALALVTPGHAGESQWAALYTNGVNLLRHRPEGVTLMSAETLSGDDSLRAINVRLLMILLRRLALREGDALVFEANDDSFRRRVQSQFESLLDDLFERGAFTGARPEQAFQVVVDGSVNTVESIDAGRFIIELRVAPSRPLAFLTVRLMQSGADGLAVESV